MQVVADVDEADIGGVVEGQRASFTVDAYPNDVFEGVVTQIRLGDASSTSSTNSTSTVVTYEVVISAPNPDLKLKPRLTANVTIYILDKKDVLSVPNKALRFTPEKPLIGNNDIVKDCEGEHKLWTREGTTFTAHPVEVGSSNGISTESISGSPAGTKVVTEATRGVMPGENMGPEGNMENSGERSPFMPGPPGSKKKKHKLWTREGTTFTAHPVEVGISNGISTEIISGIPKGTKVVTEATIGVMPGENMGPEGNMENVGERRPIKTGPPGSKKKK